MTSFRATRRAAGRERVLAAGLGVLEREGLDAVTVRRIAAELDCTAPVIYQHFTNKDELLGEIVAQGFDRLAERSRAAAVGHPTERLFRAAREYVDSALASPHLYRLMMDTSVLDAGRRSRAASRIAQDTEALLGAWAVEGCRALDVRRAAELLWAALHGVVQIAVLTGMEPSESRRLAEAGVTSLLAGWTANPPADLIRSVRQAEPESATNPKY
ncbi:MAG: TetR/AcrR family transcriptional regulator [Renibacterium sp.]|nr:TetR/AcrR family transcriptional regulator [Renibacterium sp.]